MTRETRFMQVSSSSGVTRAHVSCSLWTTHDGSVLHKSMCLLLSRSMTMLKPVITGGASCPPVVPTSFADRQL